MCSCMDETLRYGVQTSTVNQNIVSRQIGPLHSAICFSILILLVSPTAASFPLFHPYDVQRQPT